MPLYTLRSEHAARSWNTNDHRRAAQRHELLRSIEPCVPALLNQGINETICDTWWARAA